MLHASGLYANYYCATRLRLLPSDVTGPQHTSGSQRRVTLTGIYGYLYPVLFFFSMYNNKHNKYIAITRYLFNFTQLTVFRLTSSC